MRTTIEMKPEHRGALLTIAARRGQKGFSALVADAIEDYLKDEGEWERRREAVLALAGSVSAEDAEELRQATRALRETWR